MRALDNEDLSHIIRKACPYARRRPACLLQKQNPRSALSLFRLPQVVFQLHSSFQNPTREVLQPPYELTEHGWGEFEILVSVSALLPGHVCRQSREGTPPVPERCRPASADPLCGGLPGGQGGSAAQAAAVPRGRAGPGLQKGGAPPLPFPSSQAHLSRPGTLRHTAVLPAPGPPTACDPRLPKQAAPRAAAPSRPTQVVHEQLEELVFSEPVQAFQARVASRVPVPAPPYAVAAHFTAFNPAAEAARYNAVRLKVAQMRTNVQRQLDLIA